MPDQFPTYLTLPTAEAFKEFLSDCTSLTEQEYLPEEVLEGIVEAVLLSKQNPVFLAECRALWIAKHVGADQATFAKAFDKLAYIVQYWLDPMRSAFQHSASNDAIPYFIASNKEGFILLKRMPY